MAFTSGVKKTYLKTELCRARLFFCGVNGDFHILMQLLKSVMSCNISMNRFSEHLFIWKFSAEVLDVCFFVVLLNYAWQRITLSCSSLIKIQHLRLCWSTVGLKRLTLFDPSNPEPWRWDELDDICKEYKSFYIKKKPVILLNMFKGSQR